MTEDELQLELLCRASGLGALVHHCHDSRRCSGAPGFPDTVVAGRRGVAFFECKSQTGIVTMSQDFWLRMLSGAGLEARVVRPEHWPGQVDPILRAIT